MPRQTIYHCPFSNCEKECDHKSKMIDHINSHTNHKRFQCRVCGCRFVKVSHVQRHCLQHNKNGLMLECKKCKITFSTKDNLRRHLLKCRAFECEACGEVLGSNKEYTKHVMKHKEINKIRVVGEELIKTISSERGQI